MEMEDIKELNTDIANLEDEIEGVRKKLESKLKKLRKMRLKRAENEQKHIGRFFKIKKLLNTDGDIVYDFVKVIKLHNEDSVYVASFEKSQYDFGHRRESEVCYYVSLNAIMHIDEFESKDCQEITEDEFFAELDYLVKDWKRFCKEDRDVW